MTTTLLASNNNPSPCMFIDVHNSVTFLDHFEDDDDDRIMQGYLYKTCRTGKGQRRFFSVTNEETSLSYYKCRSSVAPLATLHLSTTGAIVVAYESDPSGCTFSIEVLGRAYFVKADSPQLCSEWVVELVRIKNKVAGLGLDDGSSSPLMPSRSRTRAIHGDEWFVLAAAWQKKSLASRLKQRFLQWARSILGRGVENEINSKALKDGSAADTMTTGELV
mmetsp:Transcript_8310/g.13753  ORF Transcript_8310/g.13753 Transcript_8310/m.13753 type:complete len:220 (-) Transcript_8310:141-800(-)